MKRLVLMIVPALNAMRIRFFESAKCVVILLVLAVVTAGCTKTIPVNDENGEEPQVSNVDFTPCQQTIAKSTVFSDRVEVEFTTEGVQVTYYNFEVTCDFTTVNVTHTFVNGFLNITQQAFPNQAKCVCYTDVSYSIIGISQNEVNVIFINGVQVYCYHDNDVGPLHKLLGGYVVQAIAFDSKGNAWLGAYELKNPQEANQKPEDKHYIIRYNTQAMVFYHSGNSILPEDFRILDIAVDKNDNVWFGGTGGLLRYDGKEFTFFNSQNTAMPEDVVTSIAVDSKNNIWLASCRFRQGGLVKYDGSQWTTYTPDNSALPGNLIHGIAIDKSDNVWLALGDYVNQAYLVKISNGKWDLFGEKELGFKPYYFGGIQCDSKNRLWGAIDYSLSNTMVSPSPHFFIFDGEITNLLTCGDGIRVGKQKITIDHKDNVWCFGAGATCGVWIGNRWTQLDRSEFGGSSVWIIKEDTERRIWFGTENGVYIR